jgi:EmrB/QacA subfamily drug resistance transporter
VDAEIRKPGPIALFVLLSGSLLSMVDSSVVNVAVPDIGRELNAPLSTVQWTVSGYLLALAAALPATAYLGRRFGTVKVYGLSLAAFTIASGLCAIAPDVGALIAFRVVQGLAAAPLVPLSMNLLFGGNPNVARDVPMSAGVVLFLGPALGPSIGGLLVAAFGWPSIFLVNLPIGAIALAGVPRLRRAGYVDEPERTATFDPVGLVLLSIGLTAASYGTTEAPDHGWWSPRAWPFWAGGLLLLAGYWLWARRRPEPAVDLRLLRNGQSALTMGLCVLASVAMFGVLFLLPVLVQNVQGHGPLASGLVLLPQGLVMGLSTGLARNLTGARLRWGIIAGFSAVAATSLLLVLVTVDTPLWIIALMMAGRGFGIGLVIQPLLTGMLAGLPKRELPHANTLFNVGQRLGGSIGVSLLATLFSLRVTSHVTAALGPAAAGAKAGSLADVPAALRPLVTQAALRGFRETIWAAGAIALVGILGAFALRTTPTPSPAPAPLAAR